MLEVLPIQTKAEQEAYCARCNVKYYPELMAYHAMIDGVLAGVCQLTMNENGGSIRARGLSEDAEKLSAHDRFEALFVMGRATLNFIDLCGVHIAYFDATDFTDEQTVRAIGFKKNDDGRYAMDLTNFFEHPCSHE